MGRLSALLISRRRPEPALDVGLPAERTAMAWQRTGLALAGFSALLVHVSERDVLLALPGFAGFVVALVLLVAGERRYTWTVRRIGADESCTAQRMVAALAVAVVVLSVAALGVVVALAV